MIAKIDLSALELEERVVSVNRVSKVVKGGRRFRFSAIVCVGDSRMHVGIGQGKANEVTSAIKKATENARSDVRRIPLIEGTIPYEVIGRYSASRVLLRPASSGTGIIACDTVRAVLELGGVKNILTKSLGSHKPTNLVKATMDGLMKLKTVEEIARMRGKTLEELIV